jgi:phenylacetate-CoA ligase
MSSVGPVPARHGGMAVRIAIDLWRAEREGVAGLRRRQAARLASLVAHARVYSPYFRRAYAGLGYGPVALSDLPVTAKSELMAHFDEWVTDRRVTRDVLDAFVADPTLSGVRFLDQYFVCRSSGTTGSPGIFVADRYAITVLYATYVFAALRLLRRSRWRRLIAGRMRQARLVGTGGHFAGAGMVALGQRDGTRMSARERVFSVQQPLADMVAELNAFDPAIVMGYPSAIRQLARERSAGRLRIRPALIGTGGETVSIAERRQMARAFNAPVADGYATSECLMLATTCRDEWLHYRDDWMILEPVDEDHRPVPPGQPSHTVLLTDLSNRVQPIIRYDIGDSVLVRPDRCGCGSVLPAVRVVGRRDDVLRFAADGRVVEVLPLAITAELEAVSGLERIQLVQSDPRRLTVRLLCGDGAREEAVWQHVAAVLRSFLRQQGLEHVVVALDDQRPDPLGASGKFRQVIGATGTRSDGRR